MKMSGKPLSISSVSMRSGSASEQQSISSWTSFANLAFFDRWICLHAVVEYTGSPEHTSQGQWTWPLDFELIFITSWLSVQKQREGDTCAHAIFSPTTGLGRWKSHSSCNVSVMVSKVSQKAVKIEANSSRLLLNWSTKHARGWAQ